MRGTVLLDMLFGVLVIATMIGWVYFWYLCTSKSEKLLRPLLGENAFAVACIAFPFVFFGPLLALVKAFGRDAAFWYFLTVGVALPTLGIWSIKTGKWH